ncbi:MAG: ribose 5-phosphate isomerase B [Bacteroidetes bacterium]|nr:MAG: ribose 5-phosphate isomerase B [Bacteroidota bacterium]
MKKIAFACDHAGYKTKQFLIKKLTKDGCEIKDFGTFSEESVDYPDFAHPMAAAVEEGKFDVGISLCGSGNGINMTVNKHQKIRSALCWNTEISKLARLHNNANVCALPARFVSEDEALEIVTVFLNTDFEGGRHIKRIEKIPLKN